jgi:ketosteroid isomerase-like protein
MPRQTHDELRELERDWIHAELNADVTALDGLATDDFMLVGPAGWVLDKRQWLERYRQHDLITHSLDFEVTLTRVYDTTAVTIGQHIQRAEYQGHPADGAFRATHIAVHDGGRWRLAGLHLSPIGGPPPFGTPTVKEAHA